MSEEKRPTLSACIGTYVAGDAVCHGDGENDPCWWARRCAAFKRHLDSSGEDIERHVRAGKWEDVGGEPLYYAQPVAGEDGFAAFCDALVVAEKRAAIQATKRAAKKAQATSSRKSAKRDKRRDGPSPATKRAAGKALRARAHRRRAELMAMFDSFKALLAEQVQGRKFATAGMVVPPGQLFVVDRAASSGYVSVYCRTKRGWNVPLVTLRLRTASMAFDVCLPVGVDVLKDKLSKTTFDKLKASPVVNGKFTAQILGCGKLELGLIAEAIARLVDVGAMVLPGSFDLPIVPRQQGQLGV